MAADPRVVAAAKAAAKKYGIDEATFLKVLGHEALNVFSPDRPDQGGDGGSSFGPAQLHYAGMNRSMPRAGLGDEFTRQTKLDARDPSTYAQQLDFAAKWAAQHGWGDWMGAAAEGVTGMMGIGGRPSNSGSRRHVGGAGSTPKSFNTPAAGYAEPAPPVYGETPITDPAAGDKPKTGADSLGGGFKDIASAFGDAIQQPRPLNVPMNAEMGGGPVMPSVYRPQLMPTSLAAGSGQAGGGGVDMRQLLAMLMQQGGYA
jgi:hypothetical protein